MRNNQLKEFKRFQKEHEQLPKAFLDLTLDDWSCPMLAGDTSDNSSSALD